MRSIWDVKLDDISWDELRSKLRSWLTDREKQIIVTPNAEMLLECRENNQLKKDLNDSDLAVVDSFAVECALAAQGDTLEHSRKPGVDVLLEMLKIASEVDRTVGIVGSTNEIAGRAIAYISRTFKTLDVVWIDIGRVADDAKRSTEIIEKIDATECDVLVVALGHGKQERFMQVYKNSVQSVHLMIGVGGAIDMLGGKFKRAPQILRRTGFEWLWRLFQEPKRINRILRAVVIFPIYIMIDRIRDRQLLNSVHRVLKHLTKHYGKNSNRT